LWLGVIGVLGLIAALLIIAAYPIPDVRGGWCQSGGRPRHYAVQTVTADAMYLDLVAALAVVVAAGALTGRLIWGFVVSVLTALPVTAVVLVTGFIYAGRIDCAFY
jgi:hypothetical protein